MADKHMLDVPGLERYSSDPKRIRLEDQVATIPQPSTALAIPMKTGDPHNTAPSRVVHARAVPDGCTHQQMVAILHAFGRISYITMMPRMRQALVEFEKVDEALACVQSCQSQQIYIMDRPVFFNFSTSQEITRSPYGIVPNAQSSALVDPTTAAVVPVPIVAEGANHILLFTVFNPMYPITVEVMRTICSPYGFVQRIVVFRKNGLQVLVEFDSPASSARARTQLDGADIYAGCCTLKIEFARTRKLNVYKNDDMTWDFTTQGTVKGRLLQQQGARPAATVTPAPGNGAGAPQVRPPQAGTYQQPPNYGADASSVMIAGTAPQAQTPYNVVGTPNMAGTGSVIMIYGLTPGKHNCDSVFNLLCSYGNVLKVKILPNKQGTAMAHIDNQDSAKNGIQHLHGRKLMGSNLELNYSRHSYIADYSQVGTLQDGSPCWKDFSQSRNNRFMTAEGSSKNRILPPGKLLHFYNAPPDSTAESLAEVIAKTGVSSPIGTKFFSQGAGSKSATGLMEFMDPDAALDAFVLVNHQTVFSQTGQAYTFKMAFSSNLSLDGGEN